MISRQIWNQLTRRKKQVSQPKKSLYRQHRGLRFEPLEVRQMLSVSMGTLYDIQVPGGKTVLVPLTGADSDGEPITYSFQSSDSNVTLSLVSPSGHNLALSVTGTDGTGNAFSGTMLIHLFDDLAPNTTARIEQLVSSGFYNGLPFTRVLDGFVAQGGDNGAGGTGQTIDDEFNAALTFNSPGLFAMANAGNDTSDSQFFITAIDGAGTTDPITLANMPQFLNFNYTIFGQLVSGFDTFEKIMSTQVQLNQQSNETSQPVNPITITSASLVDDAHDGVLSVFAPAGFNGNSATITVTATNTDGLSTQQQFAASAVPDTQVDPPFLGPVTNQTTTTGTPDVFTLTSTDLEGGGVTYFVVDSETGNAPANATIAIDQATGQVTVSPTPGFSGAINLLAAVRAASASDDFSNFDTQLFTVTVLPPPTLGPVTSLTTSFGSQVGFTLTSTDTPGAGVLYAIGTTDSPSGVLVSINQATGEVLIMPMPGFVGTAHLLAGVRSATSPDLQANYDVEAFTVTVAAPPTLGAVEDQVTTTNTPDELTLTSTDTAGAGVVYEVFDADTLQAPTNVTVSIDQVSGHVTLTPADGFNGVVHLLAGARSTTSPDDASSFSTQTFTLTVNPPPTMQPVSDQSTVVGAPIHFTLHSDDPAGAGVFYTVVDASTFAPPAILSITVNQLTGEVTLSPLPGFTGTFNLRAGVRAASDSDIESSYDFQPFTLVINPGPTLGVVDNVTTTVGKPASFDLTSTDPNGTGVYYQLIDPVTLGSPVLINVSIDHTTGHVTLTPVPGITGTFTLLAGVRATPSFDIQADYSTQTFTITVNPGPTLGPVSDKTTVVGAPISFDLTSTDPTGDGVFYDVSHAPQEHVSIQVDPHTGHVILTPDVGFTGMITLTAGVRGALSTEVPANYDTQTFVLNVAAGPTLGPVSNQTTTAGNAVSFTLTSNDPTGAGVVYTIVDPDTFGDPANVTVVINQATGQVTLTPAPGFIGTIDLLAGVRNTLSADQPTDYTVQAFTLTVTASAISLAQLPDIQVPGGQSVLVPLTGTDSEGNPISYTFNSSDPNVTLELVSPASKSIKLNVTGTDKDGNTFTGTLILHLFEDLTPIATARIEELVNQHFYDGKEFFRILEGFVAQNNGSTGQNFDNEIVASLKFVSPGLLAMANAGTQNGQGTNNAQFFITAIDNKGSTDPITLARMPQFLNGNYTIFGQLVSGFDIFEKIMTTLVQNSSTFPGEVSSPIQPITITSAEVITDTQNAVLRVTAPAASNGSSATITVTATNSDNVSTQQTFNAAVVVNPPTMGTVSNQTTTATTPVTFTLTSTKNDPSVGVVYGIFDATTHAAPAHVTISINQATGQATLTPEAGFTGTLNLVAGVRASTAADTFSNYDTQPFTLTVTPNAAIKPTLGPVSNQSTTTGTPLTFTLTSTDAGGNGVVYKVGDATTFGNPANATISINQATGEVTITPNPGFTGTISLLAGVRSSSDTDVQANYDTEAFTVTVNAASTTIPTLGPISNQTTNVGVPVTFTLTSTDPSGNGVVYKVVDPTSFGAPANCTVTINQATGQVTITPNAGFIGTIQLLAAVRSASADDVQANYNTEAFTLTVTATIPDAPTNLHVDASSNVGPFDGNGYVSTNVPKLVLTAVTGGTATFKLNGVTLGNGVETATGSGQYTFTVPAGKLAIGPNAITATVTTTGGTSASSTALNLIYAPDYASGVYVVPGALGSSQQVIVGWTVRKAKYNDEIGYFIADSLDGSVNGVAPGDDGYAQAALSDSSRHVIFAKGQTAGANSTITVQGGQIVVFYMIQNNTTGAFLANNPTNDLKGNNNGGAPLAFFSIEDANPDGMRHTQIIADPTTGHVQYNWEDLVSLGDSDFNDVVMTVRLAGQSAKPPATVHAPGTGNTSVTVNGSLGAGHQQSTAGDIGVFFVDNPDGSIGTIKPGDPGYAAVALALANSRVLFAAGSQAGGDGNVTVPAGKYLGFYIISNGTTANFLTSNAINATGSGPVAMFSFDDANPNNINHFRWYSPNQQQTDPSVQQLHIMDEVFGNESNFDDLTMNIDFSA